MPARDRRRECRRRLRLVARSAAEPRAKRTRGRTLEACPRCSRQPRSATASARSSKRPGSSSLTWRRSTGGRWCSGLAFFGLNLTLRSRAFFNSLRAAYPAVPFQWRRIWGAYFAAVGFNNVVPARGGDIIKLFLTRSSIPGSSYPDRGRRVLRRVDLRRRRGRARAGLRVHPGGLSQAAGLLQAQLVRHLLPGRALPPHAVPDHGAGVLGLVAFALLSVRVKAFWARVRQGVTILSDRPRYLREVAACRRVAWMCRFAAFWFLLDAFRVGGSVQERAARVRASTRWRAPCRSRPAARACSRRCS